MKALIITILLLISVNAHALDSWTPLDIAGQVVFTTMAVIDWGQTRTIARNPHYMYEDNIILGRNPDPQAVDIYFPVTIVAHAVVSAVIPNDCQLMGIKCRNIWQGFWIATEGYALNNNYKAGIKISF